MGVAAAGSKGTADDSTARPTANGALATGAQSPGPPPDEWPGLCRICGGVTPRADDPTSCTPTLCSERCLREALVAYWAARGVQATVVLRDGFARIEHLAWASPPANQTACR